MPIGAFLVNMERQRPDDRLIKCQYNPQEAGEYIISIKWSNRHVPGSPFRVRITESDDHSRHRGFSSSSSAMPRYGGPNTMSNGGDIVDEDYD